MAAAFGKFAPNLLENIKISCKSKLQEEVSYSEDCDSEKINQKNNSKDAKDGAEVVEK